MSKKQTISLKSISEKATVYARKVRPYSFLFFLAFVILLYAFVLLRVNTLSNAQPSSDAVTSQVEAAHIPRIDKSVIQQLQSLQDNSVNVQALFDQARNNPFQ